MEAAGAAAAAREEDRRAVLVTLQAEVARNYVELRSFQRQRTLAQHNLELQNQTLALMRDRLKNGVGSDLDVSRAAAWWRRRRRKCRCMTGGSGRRCIDWRC